MLLLRREWPLLLSLATTALFMLFGKNWLADLSNPAWFALMLLWPFAVILCAAFAVWCFTSPRAYRDSQPPAPPPPTQPIYIEAVPDKTPPTP